MKYLLLAMLLLQGCVYQNTNITDIMKAEKFCLDKGGVLQIRVDFSGEEVISCINGESILASRVKL